MQLVEKWQKSREKGEESEEEVSRMIISSCGGCAERLLCMSYRRWVSIADVEHVKLPVAQDYEQRRERQKQRKLEEWKEREMARCVGSELLRATEPLICKSVLTGA